MNLMRSKRRLKRCVVQSSPSSTSLQEECQVECQEECQVELLGEEQEPVVLDQQLKKLTKLHLFLFSPKKFSQFLLNSLIMQLTHQYFCYFSDACKIKFNSFIKFNDLKLLLVYKESI